MGCCQPKKQEVTKPKFSQSNSGVKELKMNYRISADTKVLGAGAFGKVFLSESIANPAFKVAIKVLNKSKLGNQIDSIKEEVQILQKLDHPNIVKYYETYIDTKYLYLVMEYCPGGELFEKIASQKDQLFNESEACLIMEKLLRAINHCHANNIVHRDIKPENIMIGSDNELKIIDFGLSKKSKDKNATLSTIAGTPYYMAPEVLEGEYNYKCDIWSMGVLLYVLVSGYLPFQGENRNEVFSKIQGGKYHFNHPEFQKVSAEGINLIQKMLVVDPKMRIAGAVALKHPWFKKFKEIKKGSEEDKLDSHILQNLKNYKGVSSLKKAAMNVLVKMLDNKEIENLRDIFMRLDKDGTGMITAHELKQVLSDKGTLQVNDEDVNKIIQEIDFQGNKSINYTEFIAATISVKNILTEEKLLAIFKQFDTDGTGQITEQNIVDAMGKLGFRITQKDIEEIMLKHDLSKSGYLTYEEFKEIFFSLT